MRRKKQQQVTAIIYDKRGRVLSVGQNSYIKSHPVQAQHAKRVGKEHNIYLHAEIAAIVKCQDLSRAHSIFISRYDSLGNPVLAKPCSICFSAISASSIKIIEHT
jgi:tRNA(Arg) A34 adenosine deaminase TadA